MTAFGPHQTVFTNARIVLADWVMVAAVAMTDGVDGTPNARAAWCQGGRIL